MMPCLYILQNVYVIIIAMNRRCFSQGQGNTINCGNVAVVDAVYGNDFSASVGGFPYKTIATAVSAVQTGQTVWILPGTYTMSSGITLKMERRCEA
jgi:hypothetical protein